MQTHIQTITERQAAAACEVVRRSITECCFADHQGDAATIEIWLANKTPENFRLWLSSPGAMAVGAFHDNALVGVALVSTAKLSLCYVVPEALHRGIGKRLLAAAEELAHKSGLEVLETESTRTADAFYRRNGFSPLGPPQSWAGLQAQPMTKRLAANAAMNTDDGAAVYPNREKP